MSNRRFQMFAAVATATAVYTVVVPYRLTFLVEGLIPPAIALPATVLLELLLLLVPFGAVALMHRSRDLWSAPALGMVLPHFAVALFNFLALGALRSLPWGSELAIDRLGFQFVIHAAVLLVGCAGLFVLGRRGSTANKRVQRTAEAVR